MKYYLFVAVDMNYSKRVVSGMDIALTLLECRFWAFTKNAPVVKKLKKGDKILIYVGGRGRHWFIGECQIAETVSDTIGLRQKEILVELGLGFMSRIVKLNNIKIFHRAIEIIPIINDLSFIPDKKNYGLSLRLPVREIPSGDYERIISGNIQ